VLLDVAGDVERLDRKLGAWQPGAIGAVYITLKRFAAKTGVALRQ
jgi:hypothetical protein